MLNDEQRDTCIPFSLKLIKLGYYLYQAGNKLILSVRLFVGRITQKLLNRYAQYFGEKMAHRTRTK